MNRHTKDRIARIPLFHDLNPPEVEALTARAIEKRFRPGENLFIEGELCTGIYLVLDGQVRIYKSARSGREITLAIEAAPSSVAEVPLFDGGAYPASVAALGEVRGAFLHTKAFQQVCLAHPEVALKMLAVVGRRVRQLVSVIELVTFGSVRQRLAGVLLEYGREAGGNTFTLKATHQELASRLGTVREVVSRNMSRFQADGLIRLTGRRVELLDAGELQREAETEL